MTSFKKGWNFGSTACLFFVLFQVLPLQAIKAQVTDTNFHRIVVAGKQYDKPGFFQWLWGKHYRKDWTTPVKVPVIMLDTVNGGLMAYQEGGGRQSKTLRLRNPEGREWVLRSIDKSFGKALPDIAKGTFIEKIANDQVSIAEPYAAITITPMAAAAGIYHTRPRIVYVPSQKALGQFSQEYGNDLYLLEQRPDENWEDAPNFGNSKNIVGTEKLLEKILKENDNLVDQEMFVRARLFDMFIGDWGRHEDQWRWAEFEEDDNKVYRPVPRDRDQAYTLFDGFLLSKAISAVAGNLQGFEKNIKDVPTYNYTAKRLDHRLTNAVTKEKWMEIANQLKASLTDQLIETSVALLPDELPAKSAKDIIEKLKSRRNKLDSYAKDYYEFLAKEVDIPATYDGEYFKIHSPSEAKVQVEIFDLNKEGLPKKKPLYSRTFSASETNEIRVYGVGGKDQFEISNTSPSNIKIRVIGGPDSDVYSGSGNDKIFVYDNEENDFAKLERYEEKFSSNPFVHVYNYEAFEYDKKGIGPILSYSSADHIHVGIKYAVEKQQFRKYPFGYQHELAFRYGINEGAPSITYTGVVNKFIGKWNLLLDAGYDWIRWYNYFGIGNETVMLTNDRNFHRARTRELVANIGLNRHFASYHDFTFNVFYQGIKVVNDAERFIAKQNPPYNEYDLKSFGGAKLDYLYQNLNNTVLPTKGFRFNTNAQFMQNIERSDSSVLNLSAIMNIYLPITRALVFTLKTGGATLTGKPEFYQLNKLGGAKNLRGYRKWRFYGESMFFNQAELQLIPDVKTFLFNGKAGLVAFYDIGRVWQSGENSDLWHYGYGGGFIISPFNKVSLAVMMGWSKNERATAIRLNAGF